MTIDQTRQLELQRKQIDQLKARNTGSGAIRVTEQDGAPDVYPVYTIKFDNGTVTDDGGGVVSVTNSGGGGSLTVEEQDGTPSVASVTTIKVPNSALIDETGGVVSLFDYPLPSTNLWAHYAARLEAYANGASVTTLTDQSGNARNATAPAGTNEAIFLTNIVNTYPVYRFDGTDDYYSIATILGNNASDGFTLYCVCRQINNSGNMSIAGTREAAGSTGWQWRFTNFTTISAFLVGATGLTTHPVPASNSHFTIYVFHRDGLNIRHGVRLWLDKVETASGFTPSGATTTRVGARGNAAEYFAGDIAELAFYNVAHTPAQVVSVINALAALYPSS